MRKLIQINLHTMIKISTFRQEIYVYMNVTCTLNKEDLGSKISFKIVLLIPTRSAYPILY